MEGSGFNLTRVRLKQQPEPPDQERSTVLQPHESSSETSTHRYIDYLHSQLQPHESSSETAINSRIEVG